jgi:two-component system response regulator HydG
MPEILLVDDDPGFRRGLALLLGQEEYAVTEAAGGSEALGLLAERAFDLALVDLRMAPLGGMDVLRGLKRAAPLTEVILLTAYGSIEGAVEAMKLGAFDFVTKPVRRDELLPRLRAGLLKGQRNREAGVLVGGVGPGFGLDHIVGQSSAIAAVRDRIQQVAPLPTTVLITGESGTGKELAARAIHACSRRANRPFVSVNCAALPEALLESEIFGHARGAFTGAVASRKGLLEEADGGTFLLDEIALAPLSFQAKLLRVLEDRAIRRVGENRVVRVDVRFLAATNRDLEAAVTEGGFREDLYYRLNVVRLHLPPLRERREDIPVLARHFLEREARRLGRQVDGFSREALAALAGYPYPGNVRELANLVEELVAFSNGSQIELAHLPPKVMARGQVPAASAPLARARTLADLEREFLKEKIVEAGGRLGAVAKEMGISRTTLWRRLRTLGLQAGQPVAPA